MSRPESTEAEVLTKAQPNEALQSYSLGNMKLADARAAGPSTSSEGFHLPSASELLGNFVKTVSDTLVRVTGGQVNDENGGGDKSSPSSPSSSPSSPSSSPREKDTCPDIRTRRDLNGECG